MTLTNCTNEEDCEERPLSHECLYTKPTDGPLHITVTINSENPELCINIYDHDFEIGNIVIQDTISEIEETYILPIGYYSATARYISGNDTILAVDADEITVSLEEYCDADCWEISDGYIDLELNK